MTTDATGRKRADANVRRLNRLYAVLSNVNQAIVRIREPQALFQEACRIAVEDGSLRMAWIGLVDRETGHLIIGAHAGDAGDFLAHLQQLLSSESLDLGPTGEALRTQLHVICNDIAHDPVIAPMRDHAARNGYASMVSLPLLIADQPVGAFNLYAAELGFFDAEEVGLLDRLALDISFALEFARNETQRHAAGQALRESEQRFRTIVESIPGVVIAIDVEGRIAITNPAVKDIFGYEPTELLGQAVEVLLPARFHTTHSLFRTSYFDSPGPRPMGAGRDLAARRKDGREFPVEIGLNFVQTGDGPLALAFITDISERKLAEAQRENMLARERIARAAAEAGQRRLDFLAEASVVLASSLDFSTTLSNVARLAVEHIADWCTVELEGAEDVTHQVVIQHKNPAMVRLAYEYRERYPTDPDAPRDVYHRVVDSGRAELYEQFPQEILTASARSPEQIELIHRLGLQSAMIVPIRSLQRTLGAITLATAESGRHYEPADLMLGEELARRAAAAIENALSYGKTQEALGEVRRLASELEQRVAERTAQLAISEEKFSKAFQASPAGISIAAQSDGRWIDVNETLANMVGYSREEMVGRTSVELGLVDAVAREKILQSIHENGYVHDVEIQVRKKDNQLLDIMMSTEQINIDGQVCALTIQYDITERKRAEAEVRRLNKDLEQRQIALEATNKELEGFSYSVSHDLRAPLRAIDGFSRVLQEKFEADLTPDAQRYLRLVRDNAQQMGHLIDDLLAFSRLGRLPFQTRSISVTDLARHVLDDLRAGPPDARRIEVTIADVPECQADPTLLKQVLVNLLANAIKFTAQREVARIELNWTPIDGETVYFIRDNGAGFDMRYAHKLFGVFQRLHRAEDFPGTGVGLAIVQRVISRHGGRVWAEAEVDKGATFYFTLGRGDNDGGHGGDTAGRGQPE